MPLQSRNSLESLQQAHPSGIRSDEFGCFFFIDYDGDLGYFIESTDGTFEPLPDWVELDTLADDERLPIIAIAERIAAAS